MLGLAVALRRRVIGGGAIGALVEQRDARVVADSHVGAVREAQREEKGLVLEHAHALVPAVRAQRRRARDEGIVRNVRVLQAGGGVCR